MPASLTYTIGESNEKTDWYYAQTKDGAWTVKFNIDERPAGRVHLTASIAGCASEKASVSVRLNGTERAVWKPGYKDASVYRSAVNSGRHTVFTTDIIGTALKVGTNLLTFYISGTGGKNGILYDCIKLEAGEQVEDGISIVAADDVCPTLSFKRIEDGHLIIDRGGKRYTVDGRRLPAKN